MAKLKINICDLCGSLRDDLPYRLSITEKGKGRGGSALRAEICQQCFGNLDSKVNAEVDLNTIRPKPQESTQTAIVTKEPVRVDDVTSMVPSAVDYAPGANRQPRARGCQHDKTSFEPPNIVCRDCGEILGETD